MELRESGYFILICRKLSETPVRCGGDNFVTPSILPRYKTGFVSVFVTTFQALLGSHFLDSD